MKKINRVSWFSVDKKGHEAVRVILNKEAIEKMGLNKIEKREVMVEYDFKNNKIIITPLHLGCDVEC